MRVYQHFKRLLSQNISWKDDDAVVDSDAFVVLL